MRVPRLEPVSAGLRRMKTPAFGRRSPVGYPGHVQPAAYCGSCVAQKMTVTEDRLVDQARCPVGH